MPSQGTGVLGGPDTTTWRWHQTLNIFSDGGGFPAVPDPATVTAPRWLTWSAYTRDSGPHAPSPSDHFAVMLTVPNTLSFRTYYGVANVTAELESAMVPFYRNAETIRRSVTSSGSSVTNTNPVASWTTFDTAAGALGGTAACLTAQVQPLRQWRDRVGHPGDELQGSGAAAFWSVLDDLAFTFEDLVTQISRERTAWDALVEVRQMLQYAGASLEHAYQRWTSSETFTYDTGLGFAVTGPGSALAWPAGAIRAVWESPQLRADFDSQRVDTTPGAENYPVSAVLGGAVNTDAMWLRLESAAKKIWLDHQSVLLDSPAASATGLIATAYEVAMRYLPTLVWPFRPDARLFGVNDPGTGGGDDSTGGGTTTTTTVVVPPPLSPPPSSRLTLGGPNTGGLPGGGTPNGTGLVPIPGPSAPSPVLRVPGGSYVAPNGVVIGPDGRAVLGRDGRPIIVPPGSRVNTNGEIVGPRGIGQLEQKDRVRNPYELPNSGVRGGNGESALERHLRSLRTPPQAPPGPTRSELLSAHGTGLKVESTARVGLSSNLPSVMDSARGTTGGAFLPATGANPNGGRKNERDRVSWLAEDEKTWGTNPGVAPGVLGGRQRVEHRRPANVRINGGIARVQSPASLGTAGQTTDVSTATE